MFLPRVNRKLIPLKMSYFFIFACLGPVVGFLPTIAKQLGYSLTTFGATMTFMSFISTIIAPTYGIIVDKYNIKKILFTSSLLGIGVVAFLFIFVPKVPLDTVAELECDSETSETIFTVYNENGLQTMSNENIFTEQNSDELITCKLKCTDAEFYKEKMDQLTNSTNICDNWMSINGTDIFNSYNYLDVTLKLKDAKQNEKSYIFQVLSAQTNGTQVQSTNCQCPLKKLCHIDCSNDDIMYAATVKTFRGQVLSLYQFWIFLGLLIMFWACSIIYTTMLNPICLEILGDKSEDFGKQKCWASIGWGGFSILVGWLVDLISINKKEKDYSPIFYACIVFTICNLVTSTKIKIVESKQTEGKWKNLYSICTKHYVISFFIWSAINTCFHTVVTHFLFWYMEDLVSVNNDHSQLVWLKTIQGLAQGIQCFGGEIPFFFWSGWIIKKLGYANCMAVVPGAMAIRMFLYTVISNPIWIIGIEILNGVSYALGYSVKMAIAKIISPPDTMNTLIGFLGFFDCIGECVGSLLGGYLFDSYGGVWSFRFFAFGSAILCVVNTIIKIFGWSKDLEALNNDAAPTKTDVKETNITDKYL